MLKRLFPLSLILYRGSDELHHDFVLVGYGRTGAGLPAPVITTV